MAADPIVALEVGTSKTLAVVGEVRDGGQMVVTGIGTTQSVGVRKGEVADIEKAAAGVRTAIGAAEESGNIDIRNVHLVVSGGHVRSIANRGVLSLLHGGGEITREDVLQLTELAVSVSLPPDREILHSVKQFFTIDDGHVVQHPEGMEGVKLALDMLILHGVRTRLRNTLKVVEYLKLEVGDVAFAGLCSALSVLTQEQKSGGVIMLDLGGGTTDYTVYTDGSLADAGVVAVGGDHITHDITMAFNIPFAQAEYLKREAGCLPPAAGSPQRVMLPQDMGLGARTVDAASLAAVMDARVNETLSVVRKQIEGVDLRRIGAGVVLTGGASQMKGMTTVAERVFQLPCALARPRNIAGIAGVETPECSACIGLLQYGLQAASEREAVSPIKLIKRWLGR